MGEIDWGAQPTLSGSHGVAAMEALHDLEKNLDWDLNIATILIFCVGQRIGDSADRQLN